MAKLVLGASEFEALPATIRQHVTEDRLLVSVKIMNVDYYEDEPATSKSWLQEMKSKWYDAFQSTGYFGLNNFRVQAGIFRDRLSYPNKTR